MKPQGSACALSPPPRPVLDRLTWLDNPSELAERHKRPIAWNAMLLVISVIQAMGLKPVMETPLRGNTCATTWCGVRAGRAYHLGAGRRAQCPLPAARGFCCLKQQSRICRRASCARDLRSKIGGRGYIRTRAANGVSVDASVSLEQRKPEVRMFRYPIPN
jgi:hypothetical protein